MSTTRRHAGGGPQPKVREDDARGAPKGGSIPGGRGGMIGNRAFVATEEQRAKVRTLAKTFPKHAEIYIARLIDVSLSTLRRHFADDLLLGRAEVIASIGAQFINRALNADALGADGKPMAKGDLDAQKFFLARMGGWSTKIETGDRAQQPYGSVVDLSRLTDEQLEEYGRLAAIAEGMDSDDGDEPGDD